MAPVRGPTARLSLLHPGKARCNAGSEKAIRRALDELKGTRASSAVRCETRGNVARTVSGPTFDESAPTTSRNADDAAQ
jgi:hypothetical protein